MLGVRQIQLRDANSFIFPCYLNIAHDYSNLKELSFITTLNKIEKKISYINFDLRGLILGVSKEFDAKLRRVILTNKAEP